ncbi:MAG: hypothetical protein HZA61_11735 [Candidatus Eisenbacteria bacterium]|uniref:DUF2269 family protein n=1 Tax=Eiseniibacteriota bacterium TaxID=2212470 RepID=A0A933SGY4_UNCEI|nr:hypothetical protein [Candidatus Eisenbacteria bacterium]
MPLPIVEYLHVLFGFTYVAALMAAHWNALAARRTTNWNERAALFELNRRLGITFALGALIGAGVLGQMLGMSLGYKMADTRSFQIANALWLVNLLALLAVDLPQGSRLAAQARAAANSGATNEPVGYTGALDRWRIGNAVQLLVFLVLLWFMVAPWHK